MRAGQFGLFIFGALAAVFAATAYAQEAPTVGIGEAMGPNGQPQNLTCESGMLAYGGSCPTTEEVSALAFSQEAKKLPEAPIQSRLMVVGAPKIYDDLYLQQRLASLQAQLQNTQAIDQSTLLSHIGVAQGANLQQTSTAISASGPSTPSVSTFSLAPGVPAFSYPPGYTSSSAATVYPTGTATASTPGTTTALSSMTPSAPTPTTPALALPSISSLGQSSLDTYNESLQLSAEITNTALLLQGALSDQMTRNGGAKTTVTIGFPITVTAPSLQDKDLAGAVAEVHVGICSGTEDDPPSIATLLPQERTYNVASLVERNFSASASAITGGIVSIGGGFLWSHKRYYLVQQQETVAFLEPQADHRCSAGSKLTSFAWQIRPVLGKQFIRPGNSVNFVQVAIPPPNKSNKDFTWATFLGGSTGPIGEACVRVIWRKPAATGLFGKKNEEYFGENLSSNDQCYAINYYRTSPNPNATVMISVTDIGQGMVSIKASTEPSHDAFLPGTTVRLANSYITPVIASTHTALEFTTSANSIVAAGRLYLVGRDGREVEAQRWPVPFPGLAMGTPSITPYSDSQSKVSLTYQDPAEGPVPGDKSPQFLNPAIDPLVVVIGGKVFGLSDAPFFAKTVSNDDPTKGEIQLIVPTALIQTSPTIELRRLLWPDSLYRKSATVRSDAFSKALPAISSTSILSSQNGLTIGLVGTGLDSLKMVFPSCATCVVPTGSTFLEVNLQKPSSATKPDSRKKEISAAKDAQPTDPTDGLKQLAFCRKSATTNDCDANYPTLLVDVPKLDAAAPKPSLDKGDPLAVNTAQAKITGTLLDQVISIEYAKASLAFRLLPGKKPSLVVDLPAAVKGAPGGYPLLVTFADKTTTAYLVTISKKDS